MTFWKISKSGHFFNLFKHKLQLWIFHNPKWIKISQNKLQKIILNKKDLRDSGPNLKKDSSLFPIGSFKGDHWLFNLWGPEPINLSPE